MWSSLPFLILIMFDIFFQKVKCLTQSGRVLFWKGGAPLLQLTPLKNFKWDVSPSPSFKIPTHHITDDDHIRGWQNVKWDDSAIKILDRKQNNVFKGNVSTFRRPRQRQTVLSEKTGSAKNLAGWSKYWVEQPMKRKKLLHFYSVPVYINCILNLANTINGTFSGC